MRKQNALLATLAALATAGLVGCLNNADPVAEASMALPSETSALVAFAGDSTRPAPARLRACSVLTAHLAALDTADSAHAGLANAIAHVCAPRIKPPRPDSLRPDSTRPKPDSLRPGPVPPKPDSLRPVPPVRPDSVRPQPTKPDSVRPVPPARPDSGFTPPRQPVKPVPPKKPVTDSAAAAE
jgi:hypothetical protein